MIRVRRALFSAYAKEGLVPLAQAAAAHGAEILSSGGTAQVLREAGLPVVTVEEVTGFGSLFGGRVKTLHPFIHGGILFRRDDAEDVASAESAGIRPIDLVVVNLYPFAEARARSASPEELIELIDVGGPALVRAAAKNHRHVAVVTRPEDYDRVRAALLSGEGTLPEALRRELAQRAFAVTAAYDAGIAAWLAESAAATTGAAGGAEAAAGAAGGGKAGAGEPAADRPAAPAPAGAGGVELPPALPEIWSVRAPLRRRLRYGENPSQAGGLYGEGDGFPFDLEQLHGKELSYNNFLDLACARDVLGEFAGPHGTARGAGGNGREGDAALAVVIKHGIPCGVAQAATLAEAYCRARDADALSAFGGVVGLSRAVDAETAERLNETFLEVVLAPDYQPDALRLLEKKKSRVVARCPASSLRHPAAGLRGRFCGAGLLLQTALPEGSGESDWRVVTRRAPTETERADLLFGWKVLKHVRSNGVLFARDRRTVGVGSGQCSRIDSVEAAIRKAAREGIELRGAVMVSDAFFPFRDSVDRAHAAGVTAVLQPGGSVRDEESIQACDEHGMAMAVNGARVFSHG